MIHPIVKFGAPGLETPSKPVKAFDEKLQELVTDMFESMYAASGVGLAAPQIGVALRLAVIDVSLGKNPEAKIVCANPDIIASRRRTTRRGRLPLSTGISRLCDAAAIRDRTRPRCFRQRIRNARRRIAGAGFLPRDRSSQWRSFYSASEHVEARSNQTKNPQIEKSRGVVISPWRCAFFFAERRNSQFPPCARCLAAPDISVEAVITQPDRPRGRGQEIDKSAR